MSPYEKMSIHLLGLIAKGLALSMNQQTLMNCPPEIEKLQTTEQKAAHFQLVLNMAQGYMAEYEQAAKGIAKMLNSEDFRRV